MASTGSDGLEALLLPNVPALAPDVDSEITNLRAFLQLVAVRHNTAVHSTKQQFDEQGAHLAHLDATLELAGTVVQDARRDTSSTQDDLKVMRDVVNAHNKDTKRDLEKLLQTADAAAIQAQFRIANAESELSNYKADNDLRADDVEGILKGFQAGFNQQVLNIVTGKLNNELEPKLKQLVRDAFDDTAAAAGAGAAPTAGAAGGRWGKGPAAAAAAAAPSTASAQQLQQLTAAVTAHAQALDQQRSSGQALQDRTDLIEGTVASLVQAGPCPCISGACPCRGTAPMREPPTAQPARVPLLDPATGQASAGQAPQHFFVGSPAQATHGAAGGVADPPGRGPVGMPAGLIGEEFGPLTLQSRCFEEKTAREPLYAYDGIPENGGHAWRSDTSDYLISKCPGAAPWLAWVEEAGSAEITTAMVDAKKQSGDIMTDALNPHVLSHLVWGFLQHCLKGVGRQTFKNTARQDGFNVWRKLTMAINSRTDCVRYTLRNQCQAPAQAGNDGLVGQCIADWESLYSRYLDAGGKAMEFEDRRGQVLRIFPKEMRKEALKRLKDFTSIAELTEWVRVQVEAEQDWDQADRLVRPRGQAVKVFERQEELDYVGGPTEDDMAALMALGSDPSPEDLLAVQRRFQRAGARSPSRSYPTDRRKEQCSNCGRMGHTAAECRSKGPPAPPGPRATREQKCANCLKPGRTARECKEPRLEGAQRLCFNCMKPGHAASQCPLNKGLKMVDRAQPEQCGDRPMFILEVLDPRPTQAKESRGRGKSRLMMQPQPKHHASQPRRKVTLASFVTGNPFGVLADADEGELIATDSSPVVPELSDSNFPEVTQASTQKPSSIKSLEGNKSTKRQTCTGAAYFGQRVANTVLACSVMEGLPPISSAEGSVCRIELSEAAPVKDSVQEHLTSGFDLLNSLAAAEGAEVAEENRDAPDLENSDDEDDEQPVAKQEFRDMPSQASVERLPQRPPRQQRGKRGVSVRYLPEGGCGCDDVNCMGDDMAMAEQLQAEAQLAFERMCFDEARGRAVKGYEARYGQMDKLKFVDGMPSEAEVNIAEVVYPPGRELNLAEIPKYLTMKVVLDSGAGAHVINAKACPGYRVEESEMSRSGAAFRGADGGRIPNLGQVTLNLVSGDSKGIGHEITSKFEVADVTRALWSVGLICDSGLKVSFSKTNAYVHDADGKELCVFVRTNGLYVADVKIENPSHPDFRRRE